MCKDPRPHTNRNDKESLLWTNEVWKFTPERDNKHPAPYPVNLPLNCIKKTKPLTGGGVVLDPYSGSGTTGIAALMEGMDYIGFDISQNYVDKARERLEHFQKTGTDIKFSFPDSSEEGSGALESFF